MRLFFPRITSTLWEIERRAQARHFNASPTDHLRIRDVRFVVGIIATAGAPRADIVLALQACDPATGEAVGWRFQLILAPPCCHHDLRRQFAGQSAPSLHALVTRHPSSGSTWPTPSPMPVAQPFRPARHKSTRWLNSFLPAIRPATRSCAQCAATGPGRRRPSAPHQNA